MLMNNIRKHKLTKALSVILIMLFTLSSCSFSKLTDPIKMYLEDLFTVLANISGHPAISLPLGKHSNGLPFGLQMIGRNFDEARLLAVSKYIMNNFSINLWNYSPMQVTLSTRNQT